MTVSIFAIALQAKRPVHRALLLSAGKREHEKRGSERDDSTSHDNPLDFEGQADKEMS